MLGCNYEELDLLGFGIGVVAFIGGLAYSYYLLQKFELNFKIVCNFLILSAIGHFIGAWALFEFAVRLGADACFYFQNATMKYQGFGYWFAFQILGYAKHYLLDESFLGAFLISGALGLIGSTYLVVTYRILLNKLCKETDLPQSLSDPKQLFYPIALLYCWPSYLFWSAGIIKDNFAFLAITMILHVITCWRLTPSNVLTLAIASFLGFMVRPYLFIIFMIAGLFYIILNSKMRLNYKIAILAIFAIAGTSVLPFLNDYAAVIHFSGKATIGAIGEYAVRQQEYMAIGSSIPVPTHNPYLMFLFIPWLVSANLLLPLIYGAKNLIGFVSSVENFYLLWWIGWFVGKRKIWKRLSGQVRVVKFLMTYFLVGMTCLSIMCTNLGLAMREKMMYAPALLLCMFLTHAYWRMLTKPAIK